MYAVWMLGVQKLRTIIVLVVIACVSSCRTADVEHGPYIIQPGEPGESSQIIGVDEAVDLSRVQYRPADVKFMQGMISHHAQALEMAALLPSRTNREDMRLLGQRIDVSQADEIKMMQVWLRDRGQVVTDLDTHHRHHDASLMPGMLTKDELARLEAATDQGFDRLFLEFMIKHHEGALIMVQALFSSPGAGQETEVFSFASDVVSDQRMEIYRMLLMLGSME